MYVNGIGFRAIERLTRVNHNTVINWVRETARKLPDAPEHLEIPKVAQVDELETFAGKKNKICIWTAVNNRLPGILAWTIADRSAKTFAKLWNRIKCWKCYFYVTDGYPVYPCFIDDFDQIIKKTVLHKCGMN